MFSLLKSCKQQSEPWHNRAVQTAECAGRDRTGETLGQSMGQHPPVSASQILALLPSENIGISFIVIFWNIQTFVLYFRTTAGCRMQFHSIKFLWGLKSGNPSETEENSTQQLQAGIHPNSLCVRDKSNHPKYQLWSSTETLPCVSPTERKLNPSFLRYSSICLHKLRKQQKP